MLMDNNRTDIKNPMGFATIITMNKNKGFPLLVKSEFSN